MRSGRGGPELIPVLRDTGLAMLVWAIAVAAALALAARRIRVCIHGVERAFMADPRGVSSR